MSTAVVQKLTVKETAARLRISPALVYSLCAAKRLRHERHGLRRGAIRIPEDAVEEYRLRCTVDAEAEVPQEPPAEPVTTGERKKGPGVELW